MRTDRDAWSAPQPAPLPGRHFQDGVSQSGRERNHLFLSQGGVQFSDVSALSGADSPADGRAFALLDWDRDGWLDVAAVNANAPLLQLFRNQLAELVPGPRNVIAVELEGGNRDAVPGEGLSNRDAVGARVTVDLGDAQLVRERQAGEGLAAQNSARLVIGIGAHTRADAVTVRWPSGRTQRVENVASGELLRVREGVVEVARSAYRVGLPVPAQAPEATTALALTTAAAAAAPEADLHVYTTLATWCEVCVRELPQVALLRDVFGDEVALHGLAVDDTDTPAKLEAWLARFRPAYHVRTDWPPEAIAGVRRWLADSLRRDGLPASIVTDGEGRIRATMWGVPTVSDLRALLRTRS